MKSKSLFSNRADPGGIGTVDFRIHGHHACHNSTHGRRLPISRNDLSYRLFWQVWKSTRRRLSTHMLALIAGNLPNIDKWDHLLRKNPRGQ